MHGHLFYNFTLPLSVKIGYTFYIYALYCKYMIKIDLWYIPKVIMKTTKNGCASFFQREDLARHRRDLGLLKDPFDDLIPVAPEKGRQL